MITFANGASYETIRVLGSSENCQGQQRKTLAISIAANLITLDEAKALYKNEAALSEITVETDGETSIQPDFTIPLEIKLSDLKTSEDETTDVVTIKLAQKSALEITQEKQAADINDTQLALIELADMISGGDGNG